MDFSSLCVQELWENAHDSEALPYWWENSKGYWGYLIPISIYDIEKYPTLITSRPNSGDFCGYLYIYFNTVHGNTALHIISEGDMIRIKEMPLNKDKIAREKLKRSFPQK